MRRGKGASVTGRAEFEMVRKALEPVCAAEGLRLECGEMTGLMPEMAGAAPVVLVAPIKD